MKQYVVPFLAYILLVPILNFFIHDSYISYAIKVAATFILLIFFWRYYRLKFRFSFLSVIVGIVIFFLWIALEGYYPLLGKIEFVPSNNVFLVSKLLGFLILAPLIEELFTRSFLMRVVISNNWSKVPIGKYTHVSFIITVLFFGFAHNRWLVGIIAGILLNLLLYKTKRIENCIAAHFTANLFLAIYIMSNSAWYFW